MAWFTDYRYGAARRRLVAVIVLALVVLAGVVWLVKEKTEEVPVPPRFSTEVPIRPIGLDVREAHPAPTSSKIMEDRYREATRAMENNDQAKAISLVTQWLDSGNAPAYAWNFRGMCYAVLRELDAAEQDFLKAIELEPDNSLYHFNRCIIQQRLGRYSDALESLRSVDPQQFAPVQIEIKELLLRLQMGEAASVRQEIETATAIAPLSVAAKQPFFQAAVYLSEGKDEAAAIQLRRARRLVGDGTFRALIDDPFFDPFRSRSPIASFFDDAAH